MPRGTKAREALANRVRRNGIPDPLGLGRPSIAVAGERHPWELGTRRLMPNGYLYVKVDEHGAMKLEARVVLEERLGRELRKGESARFRNGDVLDGRPENVVLYKNGRPVDLDDAMKRTPKKRKRRRTTVYALLPVPEEPELVRARNAREAEDKAEGQVVAVAVSRLA